MEHPINIFIAYAREDANYLAELRGHLRALERQGKVNIWYDGEILAGKKWEEEIERELERADIFLMLISASFMNSDYAYTKEMSQAIVRHDKGECVIIPIIARACAWERTPLGQLQAAVQAKPLGSALNAAARDELYTGIVNEVANAVERKQAEKTNHQRYFADETAWKNALQLNSINSFNRYLEQHPNGRHASEARQAIADIRRKQKEERNATERKAWQQAQQLNSIAAYNDYLQKYPNGAYTKEAKLAIK